MNITFRQLKLFLALADTGSVSAAARYVHITQPTASMQLREISDAVGMPLYEVVSRKIRLTDLGMELAKTARAITTEWSNFEQQALSLKGLTSGRLKVALVSTAKYFIPRLLGTFCMKYPDIEISLEVLNRDGVLKRLEQNIDDIYIMSQPPKHIQINDEVFTSNPLVLIGSKNHPLSNRKHVPFHLLENEKFILREKGSGTRMATDLHFKKLKFKPSVRLELGSNEAIVQAVIGGLGLAVVSQFAISKVSEEIAVLNCSDFPIKSSWHIVSSKSKRLSPLAKVFRSHLLENSKIS
jgi:DNA-binding transcriptional LysR family regulator